MKHKKEIKISPKLLSDVLEIEIESVIVYDNLEVDWVSCGMYPRSSYDINEVCSWIKNWILNKKYLMIKISLYSDTSRVRVESENKFIVVEEDTEAEAIISAGELSLDFEKNSHPIS